MLNFQAYYRQSRVNALRTISEMVAAEYTEANTNTNLVNLFEEMKDAGIFDHVDSATAKSLLGDALK